MPPWRWLLTRQITWMCWDASRTARMMSTGVGRSRRKRIPTPLPTTRPLLPGSKGQTGHRSCWQRGTKLPFATAKTRISLRRCFISGSRAAWPTPRCCRAKTCRTTTISTQTRRCARPTTTRCRRWRLLSTRIRVELPWPTLSMRPTPAHTPVTRSPHLEESLR